MGDSSYYAVYDYSVYEDDTANLVNSPEPAGPDTCSGNITLFSKTYNRGDNIVVTLDMEDLAEFDNRLVSVAVEGTCCWTVFTQIGYTGLSQLFSEGRYTSIDSVGKVFRDSSSVRKSQCHYVIKDI